MPAQSSVHSNALMESYKICTRLFQCNAPPYKSSKHIMTDVKLKIPTPEQMLLSVD